MSKDIRPFLPIAPTPTRALGAALPAIATPAATSPWSPRTVAPEVTGPSPAEIAAIHDEARASGRAEGVAETAALRAQLAELINKLATARAQITAPAAELVVDIASCVIETWLDHADRSALFAPIVRGWFARSPAQPATARVHPDDAAALAQAIGDAPLAITPDPTCPHGALEIRSATLELSHDWRIRLVELRGALVAALRGDLA